MNKQELIDLLGSLAIDISEAENNASSIRESYENDPDADPNITSGLFDICEKLLDLCSSAWSLHTTLTEETNE